MGRRIKPFSIDRLEIIDTEIKGRGIAKHEGRVVFVDNAVPGDIVQAFVYKKEKKQLVARIEEFIVSSPDRLEPKCNHFDICGGCKWQHLSYAAQLRFKEKQVKDALMRIAGVEAKQILPIIGNESPWHYRNKIEFTFSNRRWASTEELATSDTIDRSHALGFHVARFFDKIVDIKQCYLNEDRINAIRNEIRSFAIAQDFSFYDIREREGYLRNLVFRSSVATGELMLILITNAGDHTVAAKIFEYAERHFPELSSLIHIENTKLNDSYTDLPFKVWKGKPYLTEQLGNYKYQIGPLSFFQTNTRQAGQLYDVIKSFIKEKAALIYDLYCGAGSIGIYVNELAEKIIGIEYVAEAVADAKVNLQLNGLSHFEFFAGDMKHLLNAGLLSRYGKPEVIITDPPRAGMEKPVVEKLLDIQASQIIYVSCNPATQARDIALLKEKYEVQQVQPVDMFPHTSHIETVAHLSLKAEIR